METKITPTARNELTRAIRERYRTATGAAKHQILSEFIAITGYHPKSAIRILNRDDDDDLQRPRTRKRASLYDEATRQALIVLWEASDRVCGKRLKPLLRILLPSLERHGHLCMDAAIRVKVLAMSAATIDRMLRVPKAASSTKKLRRVVPEIRRRVAVRTFADWNDPAPGSMEMDLVAHCGDINRGSYVHSLVLTDIGSAWTECTPLVVREKTLLIEALERVRVSLPFPLRALDVDNGSEFLNQAMIDYCIGHGIELTRSRPYRKNDQAWIEQKNGAVVRRMIGYRRFEGIAVAQALARLYAASRFFVNFFQPSFKLAEKSRTGAQVTKRYHAPQTPCERLLAYQTIPEAMKVRLREVAEALDPLQLLEEIRAMQSHLVVLADGGQPYEPSTKEVNLTNFLAGLSSAWRAGEIRPTHSREPSPPRYLRRIQIVVPPLAVVVDDKLPPTLVVAPSVPIPAAPKQGPVCFTPAAMTTEQPTPAPLPATRRINRPYAFRSIWPDIARRLEARPNLNGSELFDQLQTEYPGRYARGQRNALLNLLRVWRIAAVARGVVIGRFTHRKSRFPRTWRTRRDAFEAHWPELCQHLENDPDQTGRELFAELQARYPDQYKPGQIRTLQRRLEVWRKQAARRLVFGVQDQSFVVHQPEAARNPSEVGEGGATPLLPPHPSPPRS